MEKIRIFALFCTTNLSVKDGQTWGEGGVCQSRVSPLIDYVRRTEGQIYIFCTGQWRTTYHTQGGTPKEVEVISG